MPSSAFCRAEDGNQRSSAPERKVAGAAGTVEDLDGGAPVPGGALGAREAVTRRCATPGSGEVSMWRSRYPARRVAPGVDRGMVTPPRGDVGEPVPDPLTGNDPR